MELGYLITEIKFNRRDSGLVQQKHTPDHPRIGSVAGRWNRCCAV